MPAKIQDDAAAMGCGIVVLGLLALFVGGPVWLFTPDSIKYPIFYGWKYSIPQSQVHYSKKPTDCDWDHAPMGNKDCHYEKQVFPLPNDAGKVTDVYVSWVKTPD